MNLFRRRLLLLVPFTGVSLALALRVTAAEEPPKKTLFLPKSPTAAMYIINRLSNKELIEAPRSEFVYVALLQRNGLERKYRVESLEGLAKLRNTDPLTELLRGIGELDKRGADAEPALRDLAALVLQHKAAELAARRGELEKLTSEMQLPVSRQIGYAGLLTADGSADKAWQQSESDPVKLTDLLLGIPLLRDAHLRAALHPKVEPLLHKAEPADVRRAAITAIAAVPGHEAETFNTLAAMVSAGTERVAALASLQRLPRKAWPSDKAAPLLESLVAHLQSVPVERRTEPDSVNALQFATDLATLLPPEKAKAIGKTLRALGVSVFVIRTVPEQMLYDKTLLVVEVGKPVEIILINDDAMPHNLVVVMPGAVEEIGLAAEQLPAEPDAQGRLYVPASPKVLQATKLVDAGQQAKLSFTAPSEPGEYQYVCTFPGHWRRMVGTLAAVPDVEAYLATRAATPEPTITEWKIEDLAADLSKVAAGRTLEVGKELFTRLACAQCHKLGNEGYHYGPELTGVLARYNHDRAEVLRQILQPSTVIDERYRNFEFELKDGETVSGMIVKEEADTVTVHSGASDALIQTLKKSDIKARAPQTSSAMPLGLLNTLSKEQILDLLAYIESGGAAQAQTHKH
jgi:putative heme-binding domain-containing protein